MSFDPSAPKKLVETQTWFAKVITNERKTSPNPEESAYFITPGPVLKPHERIAIYQQQYWVRLLHICQENFPLLNCLLGPNTFNQEIATPYLLHYKGNCASLMHLGEHLPQWLEEYYMQDDKALLVNCATIDLSYCRLFFAPNPAPEYHFDLKSDLFTFRDTLLSHSLDHWSKNVFPAIEHGQFHITLTRNNHNRIVWEKTNKGGTGRPCHPE